MADIIQQRRDTAARWAQYNPILMEGEVGYVTDNPNQYKIGNGRDRWNNLPLRGYTGTITQDTGDDENAVMSQKATTEKLSELGSKVDVLDLKTNYLGIEIESEILNSLNQEASSSTYIVVNCSSSYILGETVKVKFLCNTDAVITPYAYGSSAVINKTYPDIKLTANVESIVEMSIDEVQTYYGFGCLTKTAGRYSVEVVREKAKSEKLISEMLVNKEYSLNGGVVYDEYGCVKNANIVWADGTAGSLVKSSFSDTAFEYEIVTVTYNNKSIEYRYEFSPLGEIIKETLNIL